MLVYELCDKKGFNIFLGSHQVGYQNIKQYEEKQNAPTKHNKNNHILHNKQLFLKCRRTYLRSPRTDMR